MILRLTLENFKNFKKADLSLGPLTLLVGTNASGKSNIFDAFKVFQGIARGYGPADLFGEISKHGYREWAGLRGGTREAAFMGSATFTLEATLELQDEKNIKIASYLIEVNPGVNGKEPFIERERFTIENNDAIGNEFDRIRSLPDFGQGKIGAWDRRGPWSGKGPWSGQPDRFLLPTLTLEKINCDNKLKRYAELSRNAFLSMRFTDPDPIEIKKASVPGQNNLGERGENLSSVLQYLCHDEEKKRILTQWIGELTPMDVEDFDFVSDPTGKILAFLVEKNGQKISPESASDGTLRFLAIMAALLGPNAFPLNFFEELENGIHATRLHLLMELIEKTVFKASEKTDSESDEKTVSETGAQVLATTHSPLLLSAISPRAREHASLIYRLENRPDAGIKRILDLPNAEKLIEKQSLFKLHSSGWLEDAADFMENREDGD